MSIEDKTAESNLGGGGLTTAALIGAVYAAIEEFSGSIALNPLRPDVTFNIAIFVPALAALLFGANTGGLSAGMGSTFIEVQDVIFGRAQAGDLPIEVVISAFANYLGAYLTGYLAQKRETFPSTMKEAVASLSQWKRLTLDTLASVIGVAMTSSFAKAFGTEIIELDTLLQGVPIFLENFFANASVLIIFLPLSLILFDALLIWLANKGLKIDLAYRNIDVEVTETGGAEFLGAQLTERAFTQGRWTPLEIRFKNKMEQAVSFYIECVSLGKVYPHTDKSPVLQPGEEFTQTFFILPGKQKEILLRVQITPRIGKAFKKELADDTTINIKANTVDPNSYKLGVAQFSGVNFSVLGVSIVWDDIVNFINDPWTSLNAISGSIQLLSITAAIEGVLLSMFLGVVYFLEKKKKQADTLLLSFASNQDDHGYQEMERKFITKILQYQRIALPFFRVILVLSSIGGVGYLGYQGFLLYTRDDYVLDNDQRTVLLIISAVVLGLWVVALKGIELLEQFGKNVLPPWVLQPGNVILDFKPKGAFKVNEPTEVVVMAQNPTKRPGLRIVFEGMDNISPPMVELHVAPGEIVYFKIAVTPLKQEVRDVLALIYPFFDEDGNEINFGESEPFARQEIKFDVQPETAFGITKDQQQKLLQMGGIGAGVATALSFAQKFISYDITDLYTLIQENAPYLVGLQVPLGYAYFYIRNKYLTGSQASV